MTSREEFESAYRAAQIKLGINSTERLFDHGADGEYLSAATSFAWWGWQASRAVLDIESLHQNANRYLHIREHSYVEVVCESPRVSRWAPERLDALVDAEMAKGASHD